MSDSSSAGLDDSAIRALVVRLARPRRDGGHVIERAAILAAGRDSGAIEAWIVAHGGEPEQVAAPAASGLHHRPDTPSRSDRSIRRFLLPAGALDPTSLDQPN